MALLKTLDAEILDLVTEEGEIMEEIEQADIVRENIESSILDIEEHLVTHEQRITPTQPDTRASANTRGAQAEDTSNESEIPVQTSPSSRQQPSTVARTTEPEQNRECQAPQTQDQIVRSRECKVRLPKLTLKKFVVMSLHGHPFGIHSNHQFTSTQISQTSTSSTTCVPF